MSEDTPATSTDPALGSEGDSNQLPGEDTLVERGVEDPLDEGVAPPERPRPASAHFGETAWEEARGETLDQRVAQEEPEVWEVDAPPAPHRDELRAGRLVEDEDAVEAGGTDQFAVDAGVDGGAASAEEAAVHVIEEEYVVVDPMGDDDEVTYLPGTDEPGPR
ncbi:DUF5709 domain-containing protein [Cellulomonas wangsupingiae]|uniref:DUF5709 domain-containing protein n=1 Tax=Cellulomonas wangsupingiae TaxID=2968085 RepID=A0ABY5K145_9CELL|nr:DUF5709 domain-containing protein [Cellulomonas wangsupingiae]MCC2335943.1 DUF5709 domain-containing protein [Cellulomonas wangsupingiae]MCM0639768.1 DUF5709 domain-containing protein [Cellulomonas wangsupingiae]UUI64167.1 DUF5709 domain-containing protein [Cellulomonas wangsupingiae]